MDWRIACLVGRTGLYIGNALAINRNGLVLGDHEPIRGKGLRRLLEHGRTGEVILDQHKRSWRKRILAIDEQVAISFRCIAIKELDVDHPNLGKPAQLLLAGPHPSSDGVQISKNGRSSLRMESTSLPALQKTPCSARRGPGSKRTSH